MNPADTPTTPKKAAAHRAKIASKIVKMLKGQGVIDLSFSELAEACCPQEPVVNTRAIITKLILDGQIAQYGRLDHYFAIHCTKTQDFIRRRCVTLDAPIKLSGRHATMNQVKQTRELLRNSCGAQFLKLSFISSAVGFPSQLQAMCVLDDLVLNGEAVFEVRKHPDDLVADRLYRAPRPEELLPIARHRFNMESKKEEEARSSAMFLILQELERASLPGYHVCISFETLQLLTRVPERLMRKTLQFLQKRGLVSELTRTEHVAGSYFFYTACLNRKSGIQS